MRTLLELVTLIVSTGMVSAQKTKKLKGRIISEQFELLPGIKIHDKDTTLLGSTDIDGYFEIEVPVHTKELLLGFIGMEWTSVRIDGKCEYLEMIMMTDVIYDFISEKKMEKKTLQKVQEFAKETFRSA